MEIKNATLLDINAIIKLGNAVDEFQVSDEVVTFWPKDILVNCVNSKTDFLLIAEENKNIIGFIIANYNPNFKKAVIENIFVKKDYRKQNIGSQLLDCLLEKLKDLKCEYVCSLVESHNDIAIEFYIKHGFNKGINCVWLDKILEKSFKKN